MDEQRVGGAMGEMAGEATKTVQQGVEQGRAHLADLDRTIDTVKGLAEQARSSAARAGSALQEAARGAGAQVNELYRQGGRAGEYLRRHTSEQPLAALLIAGAIGFVLAAVIRRRR